MDGQGGAPQQAPDVVALAEMGVLVGQHVAEHGRVRCSHWCNVRCRADNAEQAGGGQPRRLIHRQRAVRSLQEDPPPAQLPIKAQIGQQQHKRRQSASPQPGPAQPGRGLGKIRGGRGLRRVRRRGRAGEGWRHSRRQLRDRQAGYPVFRGGVRSGRGERRGQVRHALFHAGLGKYPHSGNGGGEQLHRHQQPHQHHRPQRVAHTGADALSQREAQGQHHGNEKYGGKHPLQQHQRHIFPPLSI